MTRKYIATKLHQALEVAGDDPDWLSRAEALPHYVIDPSLAELLARSDLESTIEAMREAKITQLPFPEFVMEIEFGPLRLFFLLEEHNTLYRVHIAVLHDANALEIFPESFFAKLTDGGGIDVATYKATHEAWAIYTGVIVAFALMMLNVQGIEKEVIEPTRLNRNRIAKGKPSIPTHTVMRIGYVYDRNGERVGLGAGRTMPVHMRAGHNRHQHYGPGNADTKLIYVPPVLVNFHPGDTARPPKRIIAA